MYYLRLIKKKWPFAVITLFFICYSLLAIIRHNHYLSGYDLGIADQIVWKYSRFKIPTTTTHSYANTHILTDHIEFIYILISPVYLVFNDVRALLVLQVLLLTTSAYPLYLLCTRKKIHAFTTFAIMSSYLLFFGVQNALWNDVHSLVFAASILPWFIYFLDIHNRKGVFVSFFLALICKEDVALLLLLISSIQLVLYRKKYAFYLIIISTLYLIAIFLIYFPYFTTDGYRFQSGNNLLSNANIIYLFDTQSKREIVFSSLAWWGFLPLVNPLYLLPAFGDIAHYFTFGNNVKPAQEMFLHYQVALAPLLAWPTIVAISKIKRINSIFLGLYVLFCAAIFQYMLHLPLSYLTKSWFWDESQSIYFINQVIQHIPKDAAIVTQNNIAPHLTHRENIFTLFPSIKSYKTNSPCGGNNCESFYWAGNPQYLLVDISPEWDIRHMLTNRENFISGLKNIENLGIISVEKRIGTTTLYKIHKNP